MSRKVPLSRWEPGFWKSKEAEDREYAIPNGRLWRFYEDLNTGSRRLNRPNRADIKHSLTVEQVLERHGIKARRGSSYYQIPCPVPSHDDSHPSCVIWPDIKIWKCYGCEASGDLVSLEAYYRGHRE